MTKSRNGTRAVASSAKLSAKCLEDGPETADCAVSSHTMQKGTALRFDFERRFDPRSPLGEPGLVVLPGDPVRNQLAHHAGPLLVDRDEVPDPHLEMTGVRIDAAEDDLITEHEPLVDEIDRLFVHRIAAGHRQQAQH